MIQLFYTLMFITIFLLLAMGFEKLMDWAENDDKLFKTKDGYDLKNTWRDKKC